MNAEKLIQKALNDNPEVRLVYEIAARARDLEGKEPPREMTASTEVVAVPSPSQRAV